MEKLFVASAAAFILGAFASQDDTHVSVLGGPTFAPVLRVGGSKFDMDTGRRACRHHPGAREPAELFGGSGRAFGQSSYAGTNNARLQTSSYMGNLVYHMQMASPFGVYGGVGMGAVNANIDNGLANHGGSTVLGW